ncbi:P-loop containing nucleoside triphosphate hydrolase protein [Rhizopogon salebrosus TDB-379]|nr:P-loop containing nucleoside triphosphate hydrolase protein [Rhizopogon salebrosus TDB-379]
MAPNRQSQSHLKNVVIIGHSGAGKSSLINMLCPGANARVGGDAVGCTVEERAYTCRLDSVQQYKVHDTIGLEEPTFALFPAPKANKKLKSYLQPYIRSGTLDLLIYCMSGQRVGMKKSQQKNYKDFKKLAGGVPIVLVVTKLDNNLEGWWANNQNILKKFGMESEEHVCVTTLPNHSNETLYDESRRAVEAHIKKTLWTQIDSS